MSRWIFTQDRKNIVELKGKITISPCPNDSDLCAINCNDTILGKYKSRYIGAVLEDIETFLIMKISIYVQNSSCYRMPINQDFRKEDLK